GPAERERVERAAVVRIEELPEPLLLIAARAGGETGARRPDSLRRARDRLQPIDLGLLDVLCGPGRRLGRVGTVEQQRLELGRLAGGILFRRSVRREECYGQKDAQERLSARVN